MIVVTGAYGFIGSCLLGRLNELGYGTDVVIVDDFSVLKKEANLQGKKYRQRVERSVFLPWMEMHGREVDFVFHLGARTDTTELSDDIFNALNLEYSKAVWKLCAEYQIPLVFASSAATYGDGSMGFSDDHTLIPELKPLNAYGWSKQRFDIWALDQKQAPPLWAGLKFFNVYGPNEYHKGRMASVIMHSFNKIRDSGEMKLFRSHKPGISDGMQSRDFVFVADIVEICIFFMGKGCSLSGIYNAGTGKARSFLDLTRQTFRAMEVEEKISFIDTPEDIRETYQYFTQAHMKKLVGAGYIKSFTSLEEGVETYVRRFLLDGSHY
ncbi:MAG: ADP-glyceromanno-heptose 6-epimerase [Saprospiraceae bacterium]|nr:ADP-glyceromanno-heptose 6-epimerase [Saprospiraceae bacterium]